MKLKQIYDVQNLKLRYKNKKVLEIKTLKFHNGLIYGICGNFGSGKTSLLKVLAGEISETSGTVLYQGNKYNKSFFGKIKKHKDISYIDIKSVNSSLTVEQFITKNFVAYHFLVIISSERLTQLSNQTTPRFWGIEFQSACVYHRVYLLYYTP